MRRNISESNLTAAPNSAKGVCYVLSPNDQTARAIGDSFAADKAVTKVLHDGQDADRASIQYIIDGQAVHDGPKDVRTLVADAINTATLYLQGKVPPQTNTYKQWQDRRPRGSRRPSSP